MPTSNDSPLVCFSCHRMMTNLGVRKLHEGVRWGVLGKLGSLLVNRMHLDMYYCERCGRVAAFHDDVGRELRGKSAAR